MRDYYGKADTLHLYYVDKEPESEIAGALDELEDPNFEVLLDDSDTWCYLDIQHNSTYIISGTELELKHKHDLEKTNRKDPTCTDEGVEAYWMCSGCKKMFSDENGEHKIDEPVVISKKNHTEVIVNGKAATCEDAGMTDGKKCSSCGEILEAQKEIPALGHDWSDWAEIEPSTCTKKGQMMRICKRDSEHKEYKNIDLIPHNLTYVPAKKAAIDKEGNVEYWICTECGICFSDEAGITEIDNKDTVIQKSEFTVNVRKKQYKAKAKKKITIKSKTLYSVKGKNGKLTYKKAKGNNKIKVTKKGNIIIAKGLKKGKTYTVKVTVSTAATEHYEVCSKKVTVKIKIR